MRSLTDQSVARTPRMQRRGAALFIALAFLLLLSGVVLALFATARTGRQNASAFATGQETMRLSDAAVNLVQGQIRDATIRPRVGWASQPGMIRSFDQNNNTTAHKLYSSRQMVVPNYGQTQIQDEFEEIRTWNAGAVGKSFNAQFCDLNAPAVVRRPAPGNSNQIIETPVFPIADPGVIGSVEGFDATTAVSGTTLGNGTNRRLPMPVRWLYVLQDGQMIAPSGGDAARATFAGPAPVPTKSNPIVGRIAFWTDDETAKLNINTASEGTFWDTPRANTIVEQRMALSLPVMGEYQRIFSHPATTSLSPALGSLIPVNDAANVFLTESPFTNAVSTNNLQFYDSIVPYYDITPRISNFTNSAQTEDRTSRGGFARTSAGQPDNSQRIDLNIWTPLALDDIPGRAVVHDVDRLYATPDELFFSMRNQSGGSLRAINHPSFTSSEINKRSFFLTSYSRSPETTIFGTPRISLWPLNLDPNPSDTNNLKRTARDRATAFTSSLHTIRNGLPVSYPYFLQRQAGNYGQGLRTVNLASNQMMADASIQRNEEIFQYLRRLLSTNIPGYGDSFNSKWGGVVGINQVTAQIFDTIRIVNSARLRQTPTFERPREYQYSAFVQNWDNSHGNNQGPRAHVVPGSFTADGARGMGHFLFINEVSIVFMATEWTEVYENGRKVLRNGSEIFFENPDGSRNDSLTDAMMGNLIRRETTAMRAFLLFNSIVPTPSGLRKQTGTVLEVQGLNTLIVDLNNGPEGEFVATSLGMPATAVSRSGRVEIPRNSMSDGNVVMGGTRNFMLGSLSGSHKRVDNVSPAGDWDAGYPFAGPTISTRGATLFRFRGGTITVRLQNWRMNPNDSRETIQEIELFFPQAPPAPLPQHIFHTREQPNMETGNLGRPLWGPMDTNQTNSDYFRPSRGLSLNLRFQGDSTQRWFRGHEIGILRPGDIAFSLIIDPEGPAKGDFRYVALQRTIRADDGVFVPHPKYTVTPEAFGPTNSNDPYNNATGRQRLSRAMDGRFAISLRGAQTGYQSSNIRFEQYGYDLMPTGSEAFMRRRGTAETSRFDQDDPSQFATLVEGVSFLGTAAPASSFRMRGAKLPNNRLGDWSSSPGHLPDGGVFVMPDGGRIEKSQGGFFFDEDVDKEGAGLSNEPMRQMPSAVVFGSLLTPNATGDLVPWQTLLFTPAPAAGLNARDSTSFTAGIHQGFNSPPDHAILDYFWMPAIEPYPISENFSTAGKVNLNQQILPFSHVERTTAMRGVLRPVLVSGIDDMQASQGRTYKSWKFNSGEGLTIRHALDIDRTVQMFQERWKSGNIFKNVGEVTEIPMVPRSPQISAINYEQIISQLRNWWSTRRITSDTLREQPYLALLSRVTTKSNTFTVHYRVQALRQAPRPGRNWAEWVEGQDQVVGEYRGSTTIERFLDPNEPNIPDYTQVNLSGNYDPIDRFYRWRVLSQKQFAP